MYAYNEKDFADRAGLTHNVEFCFVLFPSNFVVSDNELATVQSECLSVRGSYAVSRDLVCVASNGIR
jgi:hypothetical protein